MDYRERFFHEYVNIRVQDGMSSYTAIQHFLHNAQIPLDYKELLVVVESYKYQLQIVSEKNVL